MRPLIIAFFLSACFLSGCVSTKMPDQPYLNQDTTYLQGMVEKLPCCDMITLGYQTWNTEYNDRGVAEDVQLDGLILNARSMLVHTVFVRKSMGKGVDTCTVEFNKITKELRRGRSALMSVMNLVSTVKGESTDPQAEPDTSLHSIEASGKVRIQDRDFPFYFRHSFTKNLVYSGWLVMNGDTLRSNQVRDTRNEGGKLKQANGYYDYWFELIRNNKPCVVIQLHKGAYGRIYLSKDLNAEEKLLCLAYISAIYNL